MDASMSELIALESRDTPLPEVWVVWGRCGPDFVAPLEYMAQEHANDQAASFPDQGPWRVHKYALAAPPAVGGEPVAHCVWEDCDQEAIYCEGHAREYADGLAAPRESPTTPIDGGPLGIAFKNLRHSDSDSSASPERQTDETGNAGSDGAVKRGENYLRFGDMTPPGDSVLIGHIQHDGDVCLQIVNRNVDGEIFKYADIEFCASGGKSINTLHALHTLVAAMAKDGPPPPRVEATAPSSIQAERPHRDEIERFRIDWTAAALPLEAAPSATELVHSSYVAETTAEILHLKAALEREHARAERYKRESGEFYRDSMSATNDANAQYAKVAALETRLLFADKLASYFACTIFPPGDEGPRLLAAYRAARDTP